MRSGLLAASLALSACRSDGERGHARTLEAASAPRDEARAASAPPLAPTRAERDELAALAALAGAILEAQRHVGTMGRERAADALLRVHAAEAVHMAEEDLAALSALIAARGLDVEAAAIRDDPVMIAQREVSTREVARLRGLSGAAFARGWLAGEQQRLELLASLASLGVRLSPDVVAGNVFRGITYHARLQADRAVVTAAGRGDG